MKELLMTGAVVTALTLSGVQSAGPLRGVNDPNAVNQAVSEGFVPHERVTSPPLMESPPTDGLLPDYGSQAYL